MFFDWKIQLEKKNNSHEIYEKKIQPTCSNEKIS